MAEGMKKEGLARHFPSVASTLMRSQVKGAAYNPRSMDDQGRRLLKRSVKRWGVVGGIVVNKRTGNTIVGGHQKVAVLDDMCHYDPSDPSTDYELRVELVDLDLRDEKALNVTLNNPNVGGQWDMDALARLLPDIDYRDAGLTEQDLHVIGVDYLLESQAQNDMASELAALRAEALPPKEPKGVATAQSDSPEEDPGDEADGEEGADWGEPVDEAAEAARRTAHVKEMKAQTAASASQRAADMEAYVVLSFDNWKAKEQFCLRFGLDPSQKFVKGEVFDQMVERVEWEGMGEDAGDGE